MAKSKSIQKLDQNEVVRASVDVIRQHRWHPDLTVTYDLASCGEPGESTRSALYERSKERNRGRSTARAWPDILVACERTRTVPLVCEVDFGHLSWKALAGIFTCIAATHCYVPSNCYGSAYAYALRQTIITVVTGNPDRGKANQEYADYLFEEYNMASRGFRKFLICPCPTLPETKGWFGHLIDTWFCKDEVSVNSSDAVASIDAASNLGEPRDG